MNDALELMQATAFMSGLIAADVPVADALDPLIDAYRARHASGAS